MVSFSSSGGSHRIWSGQVVPDRSSVVPVSLAGILFAVALQACGGGVDAVAEDRTDADSSTPAPSEAGPSHDAARADSSNGNSDGADSASEAGDAGAGSLESV